MNWKILRANSLIFILLLTLFTNAQIRATEGLTKPNVLLIYTDDHRFSGIHALAGLDVKTPAMDQLAETGIAFTNTFLMGAFSGATCIPSRAMLHTGRDLFQLEGIGHTLPKTHTTLGEAFINAGYHTHFVGKWHQDFNSLARSFHSGGKVSGKPMYLNDQFRMPYSDWDPEGNYSIENCYLLEYDENGKVKRRPITNHDKRGPSGTEKNGPHVSEVLADDASTFITNYKKNKPFFMYLAFPTPHDPRQAPQNYYDMYPPEKIELPPSYLLQHPFDNGHLTTRDELLAEFPRSQEVAQKHLSEYYAIITHLDEQIGRVIAALKKQGLYDNTIIVLVGDSGLGVGNHGLMGKQNIYDEDGIHVPFLLSGGCIGEKDKGRRIDALCYIHDIFPTLCDLAEIPKPKSLNGKSLAPVISGEQEKIRDITFHAYRQHQRALRLGDFKLIEYVRAPDNEKGRGDFVSGSRVTQLFNIASDPWETFNLADFPEYAEKVAEMRKELKNQAEKHRDTADGVRTKVDFWEFY